MIGVFFLISAYVKLFPIEILEIATVETGLINWSLSPIIARLIIASEFFFGLSLILNIKPKIISTLTALSLIVFTIYLIYILIFQGKDVNCNCFGLFMVMNPIESILKNLVLLIIICLLYFQNKAIKYPKEIIVITLIFLISILIPFIANPISYSKSKYEYNLNKPFLMDFSILYSNPNVEKPKIDLRKGKHLVTFLSSSCQHCIVAAYNLQLIAKRNPDKSIYFFINGDKNDLKKFHNLTKSAHVPHSILQAKPLLLLAGNTLPRIFLINNSYVEKIVHPNDIEESEIIEWFKK